MRHVIFVALLGVGLSTKIVKAQTDQPQNNAGKPRASKSASKYDGSLTEDGPRLPRASRVAAERRAEETEAAPSTAPAKASLTAPVAAIPPVQAVPPGPPQKNLTGEEFSLLHAGSSEKQVLEILGPPSSRVVVPDDDGHLRETLQYWVKGSPLGTVRLDNGHVVQIETKSK
jgi:hypothetical protein